MSNTRAKTKKILSPLPAIVKKTSSEIGESSGIDREMRDLMQAKFAELQLELSTSVNQILEALKLKDERIKTLEDGVSKLEKENRELKDRIEEVEAYQRADTVIISGKQLPPSKHGENVSSVVQELIKAKLNYVLRPDDISRAYRTGRATLSQSPDKRNIVVKLEHRHMKDSILQACKTSKPQDLYINESLTPGRAKILFTLRSAKRRFPGKVAACGSHDGRVYVWKKPEYASGRNAKIFINDMTKLDSFCQATFNMQVSQLVEADAGD